MSGMNGDPTESNGDGLPKWPDLIRSLVREYRGESGLARALKCPPQRVNEWLRGSRPSIEYVRRLARITDHSLVYLLAVAFEIPPDELQAPDVELAVRADPTLDRSARSHYLRQLRELRDASEFRRHRDDD